MKSLTVVALLTVAALCVAPVTSHAAIILGTLNIDGAVRVDLDDIDFLPIATGTGTFSVSAAGTLTGSFVPLALTSGTSIDLNSAVHPVGVALSLPNFMVFASAPGLHFDTAFINPGVFSSAACGLPAAPGQVCTPFPTSPFNLSNTSSGSTASFAMSGTVSDGSASPASNFTGIFTTQFSGQSYQDVLAIILGGASVTNSYSANFVVAIPEPGTVSLALGGILLLIGVARRRNRR
jgi:hypothetical protein